jgi:hypothetical protein
VRAPLPAPPREASSEGHAMRRFSVATSAVAMLQVRRPSANGRYLQHCRHPCVLFARHQSPEAVTTAQPIGL